jgi:hypothetical protein
MTEHEPLTAVAAQVFVLGDGLAVAVTGCTVTMWPRGDVLHLLLSRGAEDTVGLAVGADLVAAGLGGRVDRGTVTVWPCPGDDVLCIGLRGRGHAVIELPYAAVAVALASAADRGRGAADGSPATARHRLA